MEEAKVNSTEIENELDKYYKNYDDFYKFYKTYNFRNFAEFNYHVLNELSLFITEPDLDFELVEIMLHKIHHVMPATIRIFQKPLLHLKEEEVIMPVEAVKKIDHNTLKHIGLHSELWDDIKDKKIHPKKLMTRIYQDNYGIYENLVFCNMIDRILNFLMQNIRLLRNLIHTKQTIELNLLERLHHQLYFQALGKLYTGYINFFDQFYDVAYELLHEMNVIFKKVSSHLRFPIYQKNLKRPRYIQLRKTNILAMHKDYKQVYKMMKIFHKEQLLKEEKNKQIDKIEYILEGNNNYYYFCIILIIFSLNHFNFAFPEFQIIDLDGLLISGTFKEWEITVESKFFDECGVIEVEIKKHHRYKVVFIPLITSIYSEKSRLETNQRIINKVSKEISADEYIILTPFEVDEYDTHECFLSIVDIESFRRIQQVILRGMVATDTKRTECPFCKNGLTISQDLSYDQYSVYECRHCRTMITDTVCPTNKQPYSYTMIANLEPTIYSAKNMEQEDIRLQRKKEEGQMFFRNITKITAKLEIICPHCGDVHKHNRF